MELQRTHIIQFVGLKDGSHTFNYNIDEKFLSEYSDTPVEKCNYSITLAFEKKSNLLSMHFTVSGIINTACDRCFENFDLNISGNYNVIVKLEDRANQSHQGSEEVIFLPTNETSIDVSQFIYEFCMLSLPMRRVHPESKEGISSCDRKALEILDGHKPANIENETDPRWDNLKEVKTT